MTMNSTLEQLRLQWPNRHALTAEEVAVVLGKKATRGSIEHLRAKMKSGHYPGARKIDGRWQLPLPDLAKVLDGEGPDHPAVSAVSSSQARTGRLRSAVGPYIRFIINGRFWRDVFASLGEQDIADAIEEQINLTHIEMTRSYYEQRAKEQRERLLSELNAITQSRDQRKPPI